VKVGKMRFIYVALSLIALATGGKATLPRTDVHARKSHEDLRVIAARLRGGVACAKSRVFPRALPTIRYSAARWQRGSESAQTVKLDEQSDLQDSVHQRDSHDATAPSHAAPTADSNAVVPGSSAGASTSAGDVSVEDVQQAFAELSPAYT
jgi:hypothetical protein